MIEESAPLLNGVGHISLDKALYGSAAPATGGGLNVGHITIGGAYRYAPSFPPSVYSLSCSLPCSPQCLQLHLRRSSTNSSRAGAFCGSNTLNPVHGPASATPCNIDGSSRTKKRTVFDGPSEDNFNGSNR